MNRTGPSSGVCLSSVWTSITNVFLPQMLKSEPPRRQRITNVLRGITRVAAGRSHLNSRKQQVPASLTQESAMENTVKRIHASKSWFDLYSIVDVETDELSM